MAASSNVFSSAIAQAFAGNIKWEASGGDTMKLALLTASASPSLSSWVHYSDITNEVSNSGTGYTTGGVSLTSLTTTTTQANSWATSRANTTAYSVGQVVRPATGNGFLYICVASSGSSGGSIPTYPTVVGSTVVDGSVTWSCLGESITVFSSAAPTWSAVTFSAEYGVIYDSATGTGSTEPLVALYNFGSAQSPSAGPFTVTPDANLGWFYIATA